MSTQQPLMARLGRRYFAHRSSKVEAVASVDALHVLNEQERAALRSVERGAIFRAAMAGAFSGGLCAAAEVFASHRWPDDALSYWTLLGGVTVVAAACEIAFITWDTLRSVHELARVAGLELFGKNRQSSDEALIDSLARAALELPNPVDLKLGVNPHREAKKWRLLLASVAYKAKVGVTNFLVKLVIRRLLGRVALRGLLPFVAMPVSALWNAIVSWKVLRQARIRAMAPSAIEELVEAAFDGAPPHSPEARLSAVRAVGSAIVRTQELHPNLVRLLTAVAARAGELGTHELDDVGLFLANLKTLTPSELKLSIQILAVACVVDGRLSSRERKLWSDSLEAAGRPPSQGELRGLLKAFVRGDSDAGELLRAM